MSASGWGLAAAPPSTNVYMAGLPKGMEDARLKEVFAAYGEVVWCKVLREDRDCRTPGIVEFSNIEHATWVVANVNGGIPQGLSEPVDVKFKDEKSGFGKEGGGGGKGGNRYSPYGPPDSTGFDAFFAQAFAAAAGANGAGGLGKGGVPGAPPPPQKPAEPIPSDNVYVRGLPMHADEALLKQVFGSFGAVTQCRVCPGGETRRTALVRFASVEEAIACLTACNTGTPPAGLTDPVEVRYADNYETKHKRNSDGTEFSIEVIVKGFESSGLMPGGLGRYDNNSQCALYIAGLPSDTTDYHLFKLFSPLGPIAPRGVRALLNEDGSCKGIAFVNYQREDSVHAAIAVYNGALLPDGSKLRVQQKAQKPQPQVCHPPAVPIVDANARVVPPPGAGGVVWGGGTVPPPTMVPPPPLGAVPPPPAGDPPATSVAAAMGISLSSPPGPAGSAAGGQPAGASGGEGSGGGAFGGGAPPPGGGEPPAAAAAAAPSAEGGGSASPASPLPQARS